MRQARHAHGQGAIVGSGVVDPGDVHAQPVCRQDIVFPGVTDVHGRGRCAAKPFQGDEEWLARRFGNTHFPSGDDGPEMMVE